MDGASGMESDCLAGMSFPSGVMKCSGTRQRWWLHNTMGGLHATGTDTLWQGCMVNFMTCVVKKSGGKLIMKEPPFKSIWVQGISKISENESETSNVYLTEHLLPITQSYSVFTKTLPSECQSHFTGDIGETQKSKLLKHRQWPKGGFRVAADSEILWPGNKGRLARWVKLLTAGLHVQWPSQ